MASTYTPIATTTANGSSGTVTFSSISGSYTDLVLICNNGLGTGSQDMYLRFNGDTNTNYSNTFLNGFGSSAASYRSSNSTFMYVDWQGQPTTLTGNSIINIQNYSNSTTYKTALIRVNNPSTSVEANVGLWRSTSAITSITVNTTSGNFLSGSTFTLYGITCA